jgi:hypothetical protein
MSTTADAVGGPFQRDAWLIEDPSPPLRPLPKHFYFHRSVLSLSPSPSHALIHTRTLLLCVAATLAHLSFSLSLHGFVGFCGSSIPLSFFSKSTSRRNTNSKTREAGRRVVSCAPRPPLASSPQRLPAAAAAAALCLFFVSFFFLFLIILAAAAAAVIRLSTIL